MIKSITFQGLRNFEANLYALEVKSRFINQEEAHGFYTGYGNELNASVVGSHVVIQTGAFVVAARMGVVVSDVSVPVTVANGQVGAIIARIETFRINDDANITFISRTASTIANIPLTQDDVYAAEAENVNLVYELPIYSFTMSGGSIHNLVRLINPIKDYAAVHDLANSANAAAQNAVSTANSAEKASTIATSTANSAAGDAETAVFAANNANTVASQAVQTANAADTAANSIAGTAQQAVNIANNASGVAQQATADVAQLSEQIGERQGTTIVSGGGAIGTLNFDTDILNIDGGGA